MSEGQRSSPAPSLPASPPAIGDWMQEIVPYGIFTTDRELRVTSWNEWLVTHSGRAAEEVIGRKLLELYPDLKDRRIEERYRAALGGEISVLSAALHKYLLPVPATLPESGLPNMLQTARIAPVTRDGAVVGTFTIVEDVTQREFQAGILNRQQELDRLLSAALATLLQATNPVDEMDGIFATVRIALGLDAYVSYLTAPTGNSLQLNATSGISPKQRDAIATIHLSDEERQALNSAPVSAIVTIAAHTEALRSTGLRAQCTFPLTVGDQAIGLVTFGSYQRDTITAVDVNVLARIAHYVAIAIDRARREHETIAASQAKDDFLASLSHELRTPLNPVLLVASDAAGNPAFPEQAREAFRVIEKNALLEARLIDDLLDLTRISHGKLALETKPFDVYANLRDAINTVRPEITEGNLTLRTELGTRAEFVLGDYDRLQQVFWNVLKNAVKFTSRNGSITVTAVTDAVKHEVSIRVTDTGVGMDAKELSRVFEAFAQGDHARQGNSHRFGGLGLGLTISRKLVELHGGRIEASSMGRNQGSTFTIYLPLAPKNRTLTTPPFSMAPKDDRPGASAKADGTMPRILLVEDHEATRTSLARLLERRGYTIVSTGSAQEALSAAASDSFDLVLSDIGLPDENGFTLMRKLQEKHRLRGIALTGYGMEKDLLHSREAGFLAHLTKPINVQVLDRALAAAFQPEL